jgi:hypothetical protein
MKIILIIMTLCFIGCWGALPLHDQFGIHINGEIPSTQINVEGKIIKNVAIADSCIEGSFADFD